MGQDGDELSVGRLADVMVQQLHQHGVRRAFGVSGANIEFLAGALCSHEEIETYLMRREDSAVHAADALFRSHAEVAVVFSTSGGGALNLVPALAECAASKSKVLALVGVPDQEGWGRGAFQDTSSGQAVDLGGCFRAVGAEVLEVSTLAQAAAALSRVASYLRPEAHVHVPLVLLVTRKVQLQGVDCPPVADRPEVPEVDSDLVNSLTAWLLGGNRVLVVGEGIWASSSGPGFLAELRRSELAYCLALTAGGSTGLEGDHFLGRVGVAGFPRIDLDGREWALFGADPWAVFIDNIVAVGPRWAINWGPARPGVGEFVAHDPALVGRAVLRSYAVGRARQERAGGQGAPQLGVPPRPGPAVPERQPIDAHVSLTPELVARTVGSRVQRGSLVVADAGNTGAAALRWIDAGRVLCALGMGGMGWSIGATIGLGVARDDRVVCLVGDGAFQMSGMDALTAIEHGLPITFVVVNNGGHAMCRYRGAIEARAKAQPWQFDHRGTSALIDGLASLDIAHRRVSTPAELDDALTGPAGGVVLVEALCGPDDVPWMNQFRLDDLERV